MKMYPIPFLQIRNYKEYARVCYAFLIMDWGWPGQREMNIIGSKENDPFPYAYEGDGEIPTFDEFWANYCKHRSGLQGMASWDHEDNERIGITVLPESAAPIADFPRIFVTDYADAGEEDIECFFNCLEEAYLEIPVSSKLN